MEKNETVDKYGAQLVELLLADSDGYCMVASDINQDSDGGVWFLTHNEITGAKYRVTIKQVEI